MNSPYLCAQARLLARIALVGSAKRLNLVPPRKGEELRLGASVDELDAGGRERRRYRDRAVREEAKPRKTSERWKTGQVFEKHEPAVPGAESQRAQPGIIVTGEAF
jgi:hypothetical protein